MIHQLLNVRKFSYSKNNLSRLRNQWKVLYRVKAPEEKWTKKKRKKERKKEKRNRNATHKFKSKHNKKTKTNSSVTNPRHVSERRANSDLITSVSRSPIYLHFLIDTPTKTASHLYLTFNIRETVKLKSIFLLFSQIKNVILVGRKSVLKRECKVNTGLFPFHAQKQEYIY